MCHIVFIWTGFLPLAFDLPFPSGDDSDCEACGDEFGASGLHIAVGKKAMGFETNGRDIEKNSWDIETNGRDIETYGRGVKMYGWMTVFRVMGSSN
nr:hypothetical protein [Tanacetum cinerariifolium]GEV74474.1 hypothetical protein [Tanacetum cinerariifolium]